jgi:hypothetical protein
VPHPSAASVGFEEVSQLLFNTGAGLKYIDVIAEKLGLTENA